MLGTRHVPLGPPFLTQALPDFPAGPVPLMASLCEGTALFLVKIRRHSPTDAVFNLRPGSKLYGRSQPTGCVQAICF
jgi:hypothetical protein